MRQLSLRTSLAATRSSMVSDAGTDLPLREAVAQIAPPSAPRPGGLAPGLSVKAAAVDCEVR